MARNGLNAFTTRRLDGRNCVQTRSAREFHQALTQLALGMSIAPLMLDEMRPTSPESQGASLGGSSDLSDRVPDSWRETLGVEGSVDRITTSAENRPSSSSISFKSYLCRFYLSFNSAWFF